MGKAVLWVGFLVVLAKGISLLKEVAIATEYGRSPLVDAYNIAISLTTWLPSLLTAIFAGYFVPRLAAAHGRRDGEFSALASVLKTLTLRVAGLALLVPLVMGVWGLEWYAAGANKELQGVVREMVLVLAPLGLLVLAIGMYGVRLQGANDRGFVAADAVPPLIFSIVILGWAGPSVWALVCGTLLGFALQALWLGIRVRSHSPPIRRETGRAQYWPIVGEVGFYLVLAQVVMSFSNLIDLHYVAKFGDGQIATFSYSQKLISFILAVGTTVVSRVMTQEFASLKDAHGRQAQFRVVRTWAWLSFAAAAIVAALLWFLAHDLVRLMYVRGAFQTADSDAVAKALQFGAIQLPFQFALSVFAALMVATQSFRLNAIVAAIYIASKVMLIDLLAPTYELLGVLCAGAASFALALLVVVIVFEIFPRHLEFHHNESA